ncbi:MAG: sulfite oxidase-like oxidoreductase [Actinobacteria bacterium]|nr:sulfite oxidase-like oxidoreductase [Actinomycetota bacterium]
MSFITRGFEGRRRSREPSGRIPPGQYATLDFPVLSAGPTPRISREEWRLTLADTTGAERSWSWEEFTALPVTDITVDIHCVTKWTKLDTTWGGVTLEDLLAGVELGEATVVLAHSYDGYTTNVPLADLSGGRAMVAHTYAGEPLEPEHGGPARLLVPHLYFWKSAKWVNRLEMLTHDRPGFWESYGYHNYGDPWREQRYSGD